MIAAALRYLFPDIVIGPDDNSECVISENAIVHWARPEPMPSQTEIESVVLPATKKQHEQIINAEATRRILQAYPLEKQSSANLGIYPQTYTDTMIADIAAVIAASNAACDAVDAAVDIAGVEAVVVNWPVIGA